MEIAERCNLKLHKVDNPFPEFAVPEGHTIDSYFEEVCREGLKKRLETAVRQLELRGVRRATPHEYEARLNFEIDIIKQMKYSGYFLIVWDFIKYARDHGIPVGPGRGSATGSLVAYAMEITNIDPMQNVLLFERFLNPERVSMPDIDVDFCMNRRGEVIDYVTRKYGREQVAQIITFNTMAAKASIKDCGRALDMPYGDVDRIAKLVPATIGMTLEQALEESPDLRKAYDSDKQIRELIDTAKKLEGLVRGAGVHASAVVIAPRPLTELVPLNRTKNDEIVTAYDMKAVEKMGLLKMDFLGLTTLTVIADCLKLIEQTRGEKLDIEMIPLDDPETFKQVFHTALTSGVFQFESSGMRDILRRYKPDTVEDLTALNALYRPGPMDMIDDFIERKWGRRKVEYLLPELEGILKDSLGVIVYQEQVMRIANVLASYSLGEADLLRRAMGKKDPEAMAEQRDRFMSGAAKLGHPKAAVGEIFDQMEKFSGYGFNKSHSAAYALVAYQTAYLKTHYPVEFMAALLTSETSKPENVVKYIGECREMGIRVEPPDVQVSGAQFTPHGEAIRFGLAAVKNVGRQRDRVDHEGARERWAGDFKSFWEFCEKVDLRVMNKRVIESLIKAGALDSLGKRGQLYGGGGQGDGARAEGAEAMRRKGRAGLFGLFDEAPAHGRDADDLPQLPDWEEGERLANEKEVLGFFVSGHPLDKYAEKLRNLTGVISDGRGAGAQAAGAALGTAGRSGGRDSGGGHDSWAARAEEQARPEALCAGVARRRDRKDRTDLLLARLRAAGGAVEDRSAGADSRDADGRGRFGAEDFGEPDSAARRGAGEAADGRAHPHQSRSRDGRDVCRTEERGGRRAGAGQGDAAPGEEGRVRRDPGAGRDERGGGPRLGGARGRAGRQGRRAGDGLGRHGAISATGSADGERAELWYLADRCRRHCARAGDPVHSCRGGPGDQPV